MEDELAAIRHGKLAPPERVAGRAGSGPLSVVCH
jgi:hypothetical protein